MSLSPYSPKGTGILLKYSNYREPIGISKPRAQLFLKHHPGRETPARFRYSSPSPRPSQLFFGLALDEFLLKTPPVSFSIIQSSRRGRSATEKNVSISLLRPPPLSSFLHSSVSRCPSRLSVSLPFAHFILSHAERHEGLSQQKKGQKITKQNANIVILQLYVLPTREIKIGRACVKTQGSLQHL